MPGSELAQRVAVAAIGIPVAVAVIHLGGWIFGALLALVAVGAALELYRLSRLRGVEPFAAVGALTAAVFVLVAAGRLTAGGVSPLWVPLAMVFLLVTSGAAVWARGVEGQPLFAIAVTIFGAFFTGWTLSHALFLRHELTDGAVLSMAGAPALLATEAWAGTSLVVFAVGLTWINDSCAYFAGRAWGRRKLIPKVSPGKTVVGAVAGVIGAVVVGAVFSWIVLEGWYGLPVGLIEGALGGGLIAVTAQVGDLVESVFKREAGVKDSGHLLPGHGGVLDRFDALFFTLPVAYGYMAVLLGWSGGLS